MAAKALFVVPLGDEKVIKEMVEQSRTQPTGRTSSVEHCPLSQGHDSAQGRLPGLLLFGTQASSIQLHHRLPKGQGKLRARSLLSEEAWRAYSRL